MAVTSHTTYTYCIIRVSRCSFYLLLCCISAILNHNYTSKLSATVLLSDRKEVLETQSKIQLKIYKSYTHIIIIVHCHVQIWFLLKLNIENKGNKSSRTNITIIMNNDEYIV